MLNTTLKRPAIAMLELIFAIVVMGIVLMSAPMLISTSTKSGFVAIQQEAIHEAASHLNMIMGYHWDENDADERYVDPILQVTSGNGDLDEDGNTGRRLGTPEESYRAFIRSDGTDDLAASALATFGAADGTETEKDDIDDFSGNTDLTEIDTAVADNVEKTTININAVVAYIPDTPGSGSYADPGADNKITFTPNFTANSGTSTNIKRITVTLTSTSGVTELDKQIILHAFSCNIGGYTLAERGF
ncbi:hypothetical protein [Sulfurovum sp. AR]|uniref:hypothetical protein n=1 Tax=Sulfurovum sp. AR TaxID=1165841 RepID=UPI00025C4B2F|nr:hypothetical protein [Sulfurovum sp. AR]EIF50966.1 hypothetical protein SULAR_06343 [Sulfurovum sp. AR]